MINQTVNTLKQLITPDDELNKKRVGDSQRILNAFDNNIIITQLLYYKEKNTTKILLKSRSLKYNVITQYFQ